MKFFGNHTDGIEIFRTGKSRKIDQQFGNKAPFNQ
jgi:hypothetical protein